MDRSELIKQCDEFVIPTYARSDLVVYNTKGSKVWDISGKEYVDFFPGWAVSGIGHCHDRIIKALKEQIEKVLHVPNNYYNEYQGQLAKKLVEISFPGKCFFCNSGAESVEAAIKLCRRYGESEGRNEIIVMENSFHGRTFGALSATGQEKYKKGFGNLLEGFITIPFNDIVALKDSINEKTIAVLIEPIQGEGGINVAGGGYLEEVREICANKDILLIFDEVQTGMGRTGEMFGYQHYDITPDIITLAKSLGGGVPIGAMVAGKKCQDVLEPGTHASTFGGSPLACKAAIETINLIQEENLLSNVKRMGGCFRDRLVKFKRKFGFVEEIKGKGLMLAMKLSIPSKSIVQDCIEEGLLINCTQENIIRLLPAINIKKDIVDKGLNILEKVLKQRSK